MRFNKIYYLSVLTFLFLGQLSFAQNAISGTVTDASGEGLPGVTVQIKGTPDGAITDIDGKYSISAGSDQTLVFTYVGFATQEVLVGGQTTIDILLEEDFDELDEVVVVGYTTQRKEDLTGSIAVVDMDEVGTVPYANVLQGLAGRVPGVNIQQDGQPGQGRTQVRIRGLTTLNNNNPLYVIDGVPTQENIDNLNPNDIESFQVLKDASASIYGVRSAGGVIIITTKKGRGDKVNIEAGYQRGIQTVVNKIDLLNAQQWGEVHWQAQLNAGIEMPRHEQYGNGDPTMVGQPSAQPVISEVPFIIANGQVYKYTQTGTDWHDEVYRDAVQSQYYFNVSRGGEKGNVQFGMSLFEQDGLINETYYDRITSRVNSSTLLADWIRIGENLQVTYSDQVRIGNQQGQDGIPLDVIRQHPLHPVVDVQGNYAGRIDGFPDVRNMVSVLEKNRENTTDSWRIFGNAYAEVDIFKPMNFLSTNHQLKLKTSYALDYSKFYDRRFNARFSEGQYDVQTNTLFNAHGEGTTTTFSNTLEYNWTKGDHRVKALAGQEAIAFEFRTINGLASDFEIETADFTFLDAGSNSQSGGRGTEWGIHSYFGRLEYSYKDRYSINGLVRQDETSRFEPVGVFPSVSARWNVSNEAFFNKVPDFVNQLSFRGSYGKLGNQGITDNDFPYLSLVGGNINYANYDLGGTNTQVNQGYIVLSRGNPNLQWETTTQTNIGFDLYLLNNSLSVTMDFFDKSTEDVIFRQPQIDALGEGDLPQGNVINIDNKGFDAMVNYYLENGDFNFNASLQFSKYRNEVVDIPVGVGLLAPDSAYSYLTGGAFPGEIRVATGQPIGSFFGLQVEGIFQNADDVANHADQMSQWTTPEEGIGRLKYADINNDGIIDDLDRTFIGDPNPDFTMGLNLSAEYKGITLSTFMYASVGNDVYNFTRWYTDFAQNGSFNRGTRILDAWSPTNTGSSIPAPTVDSGNREDRISSYYVEDGSFLRMRNIRLGYEIPQEFTFGVRVNVYAEMQNVFTLTDYTGVDPEVPYPDGSVNFPGIDKGVYPLPKTTLLGINIKL